jgi:uncharacterized membrane protein
VSRSSRSLALLSYLLSLPGALFVLLTRRDDAFAAYHARQSLELALIARITPLLWAVLAWALAWIPLVGAMLGVILFSLVIAVYAGLALSWAAGIVFALRGQVRQVPLAGLRAALRRKAPPAALVPVAPEAEHRAATELIERTTPDA